MQGVVTKMNLYPFQQEGIKFAIEHKRCLIADEMGLGKTVQAIGLINELGCHPVLIICPASLKLNWKAELEMWLHHAEGEPTHKIGVIDCNIWIENLDITIINYDLLKKFRQQIRAHKWGLLICDESHYIKNEKANRTEEILGSKAIEPIQTQRTLFLTGTPILNRPSELWTTFRALAPEEFSSFFQFARRYCDAKKVKVARDKEVWDFSGASNLEELKGRMKKFSIRRTKDQVLKELPPKRRQIIVLPNLTRDLTDGEINLHDESEGLLDRIRELPFGSQEIQQYRDKRKLMLDQLAKLRVELAEQKLPYVLEMMDSIDHKTVIFAHHRKLIEMLSLHKDAVQLHGGMNQEDRQESVERFQKDPSVKFFIGSLTAAGVGITLTASSHVIFAESSWVPGVQQQAEDRCHRIGQQDSVLVQYLVFEDSLDMRMMKSLEKKEKIIRRAV